MARKHVFYEVTRMAGYAVLAPGEWGLEAYLIHVRAVNEFLTKQPTGAYPRDLVAADYFDDQWALEKFPLSKAQKEEIDRRVAHLSLQRLDNAAPFNWGSFFNQDRTGLAVRSLASFGRFMKALQEAHPERVPWFRDAHIRGKELLDGLVRTLPQA